MGRLTRSKALGFNWQKFELVSDNVEYSTCEFRLLGNRSVTLRKHDTRGCVWKNQYLLIVERRLLHIANILVHNIATTRK